ncbi:hypothetical protein N2152v2_010845 [Parachlorella kessleri]
MEYNVEQLSSLVARHAPVFQLHPADRFMPCSVEFFMQHSSLAAELPGTGQRLLVPRGSVTAELLLDYQRQNPPPTLLRLDLDPAARPGTAKEHIDSVPLYAHVKEILRTASEPPGLYIEAPNRSSSSSGGGGGSDGSQVEALEINYLTFYAYNGPYNVGGFRLVQTGDHDGDWEHVTARVHPSTGELLGMWYNAHRSRDGMWVEGSRVPRNEHGRPLAYVALHGHGVYPMAARIPRHFFLGNDLTSGRGPTWAPATVVLLPPVHGWDAQPALPAEHGEGWQHGVQRGSIRLDQAPAAVPGDSGEAVAVALRRGEAAAAGVEQQSSAGLGFSMQRLSLGASGAAEQGGSTAGPVNGEANVSTPQQQETISAQPMNGEGGSATHVAAAGEEEPAGRQASVPQSDQPVGNAPVGSSDAGDAQAGHLAARSATQESNGSSASASVVRSTSNSSGRLHLRRLHSVPSRGSRLSSSDSWSDSAAAPGQKPASALASSLPSTGVQVVTDDPCLWLFFRGLWGQTDAPIIQHWFHTAEPPLSRTALLRIFGHFWPERHSLT